MGSSERGFADLLNIDRMALTRMRKNGVPNVLRSFLPEGFSLKDQKVRVAAYESPQCGVYINVYSSCTIESLIIAYALALGHQKLQKNQYHIGLRCVILQSALIRTALEALIKEACGVDLQIQKSIQRHYQDVIFILGKNILFKSLKIAYPDREDKKYSGLMATCFKYCYEDILGKEFYQQIKKEKKSYPVHQYIEDQEKRQKCVFYINALASQIAVHKCRIPEARDLTRNVIEEVLRQDLYPLFYHFCHEVALQNPNRYRRLLGPLKQGYWLILDSRKVFADGFVHLKKKDDYILSDRELDGRL